MGDGRDDPTDLRVEHGSAQVDEDDLPARDDLLPDDPPADAPASGDRGSRSAIAAPVPAHGETASREQLQEAAAAAEQDDAGRGGPDQGDTGADDRS